MIIIDPGHGGKDPGAIGNGLNEKDVVLRISKKVTKRLKDHNQKALMTRDKDIFIDLTERSNISNRNNGEVFVSIHCNSFHNSNANGVETYHYPSSIEGNKLATMVQNELKGLFKSNRGVKSANFSVLRKTKAIAILVELGFISNKSDVDVMLNKEDEIVEAIVNGILKYKGVKYMPMDKNKNDVKNHWAEKEIEEVKKKGLMRGYDDGSFRPDEYLTRAEMAVILNRLK